MTRSTLQIRIHSSETQSVVAMSASHRWMMVRVSTATHGRLMQLRDRREQARIRGQLQATPHDTVTQDDVVSYLLDHEERTQERRRRSRKRNRARHSTRANASEFGATLYTAPSNGAEDFGEGGKTLR